MAILTQVTTFDKGQFDMIAEASSRLAHAASSRPITDSDGLNCMYVQATPFVSLHTVDLRIFSLVVEVRNGTT